MAIMITASTTLTKISDECTVSLPSAFMFSCGGFRDVNGLLQSSAQMDSSLLNDLPDVFDPILLVLNT